MNECGYFQHSGLETKPSRNSVNKVGWERLLTGLFIYTLINIYTYKTEGLRQGDSTQASYLGGCGLKS